MMMMMNQKASSLEAPPLPLGPPPRLKTINSSVPRKHNKKRANSKFRKQYLKRPYANN